MNAKRSMNLKALLLVPVLLFAGAGMVSAKPALSGDLKDQAIALHYVKCLAKAADRTDDGIADSRDIAAKIMPMCADEFAREQVAFSNTLSQDERQTYYRMTLQQQPELAMSVVLSERNWARTHKTGHQRLAETN